jgi:two-component sensor histidine kinase
VLDGCPAADDAILVLSELAANAVVHSASQQPGGTFTVTADIRHGQHVRIEVRDDGGPWHHPGHQDRPHGLDIIARLATSHGVSGDPLTGWATWAIISWHGTSSHAKPCKSPP